MRLHTAGAALFSVLVGSQVAFAAPTAVPCLAIPPGPSGANPWTSNATCDPMLVSVLFNNPATGGLTFDFHGGACDKSLQVELVTNESTTVTTDIALHASCVSGGVVVDVCCIADDVAAVPEVRGVGLRGLGFQAWRPTAGDVADKLYLSTQSFPAMSLYRDVGMNPDFAAWVYGEDGADFIEAPLQQPAGFEIVTEIHGGPGTDALVGSDFVDHIYGEDGADVILAGSGDDYVGGGAGNDKIAGYFGSDTLYGGTGLDYICGDFAGCLPPGGGPCNAAAMNMIASWSVACTGWASGQADSIYLGEGIYAGGTPTRSEAHGQGGGDSIDGGSGPAYLDGGSGIDQIRGSSTGYSEVRAGDGNDEVCTYVGNNFVYGDGDDDTLVSFAPPGTPDTLDGGLLFFDTCYPFSFNCEAVGVAVCPF